MDYDFVEGRSRYTNTFKDKLAKDIDGSTVGHVVITKKFFIRQVNASLKDSLYTDIPDLQNQVMY